ENAPAADRPPLPDLRAGPFAQFIITTDSPNALLTRPRWGILRFEMARAGAALDLARGLRDRPRGYVSLVWHKNPVSTLQQPVGMGRAATELLCYDALLHAHENKIEQALRSCHAAVNAASAIGDAPIYVAQEVRGSLHGEAVRMLQQVVGLGRPSAEALASLQARLAEEAEAPLLLIAARG